MLKVFILFLMISSLLLGTCEDKLQKAGEALDTCIQLNTAVEGAMQSCRKELGECIDKATPSESFFNSTLFKVILFGAGIVTAKAVLK